MKTMMVALCTLLACGGTESIQGAEGSTGARGPQGEQGSPGSAGPQGRQGDPGSLHLSKDSLYVVASAPSSFQGTGKITRECFESKDVIVTGGCIAKASAFLVAAYPENPVRTESLSGWTCEASGSGTIEVYAVCLRGQ